MLHYAGLLLVVISWLLGTVVLVKWHDPNLLTISKHAATNRTSRWLFGGCLSVIGALFYWWLIGWLQPHIQPSSAFTALATITVATLIAAAVFPDLPGWQRKVHVFSAYTMAVSYAPLAVVITFAHIPHTARVLCSLLLGYMVVTFIVFVLYKRSRQYYLTFQALYIVAFELIILFAAYLH